MLRCFKITLHYSLSIFVILLFTYGIKQSLKITHHEKTQEVDAFYWHTGNSYSVAITDYQGKITLRRMIANNLGCITLKLILC